MKKLFLKVLGITVVLAIVAGLLVGWYMSFFVGLYYKSAPIHLSILYGVVYPIIVVWGGVFIFNKIVKA